MDFSKWEKEQKDKLEASEEKQCKIRQRESDVDAISMSNIVQLLNRSSIYFLSLQRRGYDNYCRIRFI